LASTATFIPLSLSVAINSGCVIELSVSSSKATSKPAATNNAATKSSCLFDTFVNGDTTFAKIRQQASHLGVHPDNLDNCAEIFVESALYAGLAKQNGEAVTFYVAPQDNNDPEEISEDKEQEGTAEEKKDLETPTPPSTGASARKQQPNQAKANIDIKIDPSMDPEKLEKHLSALRKYGLI
jgi:hypothetical protein